MPTSEAKKTKGTPMAGNNGQGNFTHITLLLDASYSMLSLKDAVVKVVDSLIEKWASQSLALDDMTRLSVYQFASENHLPNGKSLECIWYDTDITRLKTIQGRYVVANGATALIGSTIQVQKELALTPTIHGNHTFLFFAVTDGDNNRENHRAGELRALLDSLPSMWSMAVLVPHMGGKIDAMRYGFPEGNIQIWDATSEAGIEEAGERIAAATTSYLTTRSTDASFKGTKTLFVGAQVDAKAIKAANLTPLVTKDRKIVRVTKTEDSFEKVVKPVTKSRLKPEMGGFVEIEKFVRRINKGVYPIGDAFYELVKTEKVQADKEIAVVENNTNQVFVGDGARQLLGLPHGVCTVKPDMNPDYTIFIQSNSRNRHLPHGCQVMLINR